MEAKSIEATEFRNKQRDQWNGAASGWNEWSEFMDDHTGAVARRLVEMADVEEGDRVLDVAAGYGEPSLTAARKVGPEGGVIATDISAEMLSFGRQRAAANGVENIEFMQSDAGSLDFPPGSFDAAVSRWGIIFDPDGEGAADRVRGFLKPGSRFAISSWGTPDRVPFLAIAMKTAMERLDVPPPPPGTPGPLSRPTPEAIGGLLEGGGFSDIEVEELEVAFPFDSPDAYVTYTKAIAAPIVAMISPHPEDVQRETWDAIADATRERADADGRVTLSNQVLLAAGRA
ncbi:MAG TPA: methyltransferase domain-containing protein [Solirubrobacterales bacterium]|nr:methyltransferase domain-containing protein [Solirubrobacterales bacterium]